MSPKPSLTAKRVLVLGAETEVGRAVTTAAAEAGASVAAVAATADAEAAFAVQRLARRLSSSERKVISQAIDATNEAAVRVMVRRVSKELGGLDAVVFTAPASTGGHALELAQTFADKEFDRATAPGVFVVAAPDWPMDKSMDLSVSRFPPRLKPQSGLVVLAMKERLPGQVADDVIRAIAGKAESG